MTVTTTDTTESYTGDGGTLVFNVEFQFWETSELAVYLRTIATGVEVLQTETTHYSVSGGNSSNGQVTFVTAPTTLEEVHIRRNTARTQQIDLTNSTKLSSASVERGLDRSVLLDQEDAAEIARAMLIPVTDGDLDMSLPNSVDRANRALSFDASGLPEALSPFSFRAVLAAKTINVTAADRVLHIYKFGFFSPIVWRFLGGTEGQILTLLLETQVVITHAIGGTGEIYVEGDADHTVSSSPAGTMQIVYSSAYGVSRWYEVPRA